VFLRHEADQLILGLYLGVCFTVFLLLLRAEHTGWRVPHRGEASRTSSIVSRVARSPALADGPVLFLAVAIPLYVLGGCARIDSVPTEYGWYALTLFGVLLYEVIRGRFVAPLARIAVYAAALFVVFLTIGSPSDGSIHIGALETTYFGAIAVSVALTVRFSQEVKFGTTPLDYLVLFSVVLVALFPMNSRQTELLSIILIEGFIILYGCELLMVRMARRWTPLILASLGALAVIGVRGIASV
jgi:UDP-GlcNAc:undecaprenyl-phosphate GlcNAc-1-phosphate transferase